MKYIIIISLGLLTISCENRLISQMNDDLDSLDQEMKLVETKITGIEAERIKNFVDTISYDMDYLELFLEGDTLERELAITIGSYSDLTRNLEKWESAYMDHLQEVAYAKNQLKSLREDVNNGLIPKELFDQAKPSEAKAVKQLKETSGNMKVWYDSNIDRFDYLKNKVDSIMGKEVQ
jgi:hypothetical protein